MCFFNFSHPNGYTLRDFLLNKYIFKSYKVNLNAVNYSKLYLPILAFLKN